MSNTFVEILDNFYPDPLIIRNLALSLDYSPKLGANYPGGEAYSDTVDWAPVKQRVFSCVQSKNEEKPIPGKNFLQGKFRLANSADNETRPDGVHQDQQRYSAVIYLSRNQDLSGGIGLYKCKGSGELAMTTKWVQMISIRSNAVPGDEAFTAYLKSYMRDWDNWQQIGELPMQFNRAIILMSRCFHASTGLFGSSKIDGRLTQHFEYYI